MPAALKTTVTELPQSRVRVDVEVPAGEVERRLERKASQLGRELKLPGFRRGKVPAPLVIQRIGREAVLEEAVRDTLSSWYSDAIASSGVVPVGDPQLDVGALPASGEALAFSIEIGVLPTAQLGRYRELEVGRREPEVDDEQLERGVAAVRERLARLETAERAAAEGDFVVVDYTGALLAQDDTGDAAADDTGDAAVAGPEDAAAGEEGARAFEGGEGRDQLVELGAGRLIPGFEEGLLGARAGETRTVRASFPADYGNPALAGRAASFEVKVKEVKAKQLPELDDDFALDAGFDDLAQLREDMARGLYEAEEEQIEAEFREAALDAAVAGARVEVPPELVQARAQEMWERLLHSLSHRGISREAYLQIVGRGEQELLAEMQPQAERALRREAVLTAVVAAEAIDPSEEQLLAALAPVAEREDRAAPELLEQLRASGRLDELRDEVAARAAIDLIAASAVPIPLARAQARAQLWTPEKAAGEDAGAAPAGEPPPRLWTPAGQRTASS